MSNTRTFTDEEQAKIQQIMARPDVAGYDEAVGRFLLAEQEAAKAAGLPTTILRKYEPDDREPSFWLDVPALHSDPDTATHPWPNWGSQEEMEQAGLLLDQQLRYLPAANGQLVSKKHFCQVMGHVAMAVIQPFCAALGVVNDGAFGRIFVRMSDNVLNMVHPSGTYVETHDPEGRTYWQRIGPSPTQWQLDMPASDQIFNVWVHAFMLAVCVRCGTMPVKAAVLDDRDQAEARVRAAKVVHDMLANLPPGSWPAPEAHAISDLRRMAEDVRATDDRPRAVVLTTESPYSTGVNLTMHDGTPIGHMVMEATLRIRAGQPNCLDLVTHAPSVMAMVLDYNMMLDAEQDLEAVRDVLRDVSEKGGDISGLGYHLNALQNCILTAKAMMRNPKNVLHGKTLRQWVTEFGRGGDEVIVVAEGINNSDPNGVRVFPDGAAWMAIGPDYESGPEDLLAFADSPTEAVEAWYKEHGHTILVPNDQGMTRAELIQALHEITQHRCITLLPAEGDTKVDVVKEGDMKSPVLAGIWRAEQTPTYAAWWKQAEHPDWLTRPGEHGLPQKYTDVQPLNDAARAQAEGGPLDPNVPTLVGERGPEIQTGVDDKPTEV